LTFACTIAGISLCLSLAACGPNLEGAIRVDAYGPDPAQTDTLDPEQMQDAVRRGLVIAYSPGDIIDLSMALQSDIVKSPKIEPIRLEVRQPIWLYSGQSGLYLSTNGVTFRPWRQMVEGSFQFGVGLNGGTKQNLANIQLHGDLKGR
jgi:hypothetical protein